MRAYMTEKQSTSFGARLLAGESPETTANPEYLARSITSAVAGYMRREVMWTDGAATVKGDLLVVSWRVGKPHSTTALKTSDPVVVAYLPPGNYACYADMLRALRVPILVLEATP